MALGDGPLCPYRHYATHSPSIYFSLEYILFLSWLRLGQNLPILSECATAWRKGERLCSLGAISSSADLPTSSSAH